MKIGIITIHFSYSYGACLQTLATVKAVEKLGHEGKIIDYQDYYSTRRHRWYTIDSHTSIQSNIKEIIKRVIYGWHRNGEKNFAQFYQELPKTKKVYFSFNELNQLDNDEEFDIVVSGSDQIWNPEIFSNGLQPAYYLGFETKAKKIAYASSMGSYVPDDKTRSLQQSYLRKYSHIGVREQYTSDILNHEMGLMATTVADPTLLLNKEEWRQIQQTIQMPKRYILLYVLNVASFDKKYGDVVRYYKDKFSAEVVQISIYSYKLNCSDKLVANCTMEQFVFAVNNSCVVITDSFHGMTISLLQEKDFVILKMSNPKRIETLLNRIELMDYYCENMDQVKKLSYPIDYSSITPRIEEYRDESLQWLKNSIEK